MPARWFDASIGTQRRLRGDTDGTESTVFATDPDFVPAAGRRPSRIPDPVDSLPCFQEAETMSLVSWLRGFRETKVIALHVQTLLDRCTHRIEAAVVARSAELPRAEARGYLRAKAMHRLLTALEASGDAAVAGIPVRLHETVLASAADRLTAVLWRHREQRLLVVPVHRRAA